MFRGQVNPVTGRQEWAVEERDVESEDGDLSRELARSQYGDMLHDTARNQLYCQAIERAVSAMKAVGRSPHVLDIGTGTGLLSLMAARTGATRVTAVEVMGPMVKIAREVISANGYSDIIRVVGKRSTDMTERDMEGGRANILVTEVFDTELIGEGALVTYSHALQNLMEPDCIVIPDSVAVYVQLVRSEFLWSHHKLVPEAFPVSVSVPTDWRHCPGAPSLWDLHVEQLQIPQQLITLSGPTQMAKFILSDPGMSSERSIHNVVLPVTESGTCHGVLMWWTADMSGSTLSMSPWQYTQWRDHWLQAVQLLPTPLNVKKGDSLSVRLGHDDYSMWFHVSPSLPPPPPLPFPAKRPLCTCGVHTAWSRSRIAMLNDTPRTKLYLSALTQALSGKSRVMCVSDGSLLPLLLAKSNLPSLTHVYTLESNKHSARVYETLLESNPLPPGRNIHVLTKSSHDVTISDLVNGTTPTEVPLIEAVIGEPYFRTSLLPWHNLHFWYARDALSSLTSPHPVVVPSSASLMAIAVSFQDLYSLRAPVGNVEGFDISAFDKRVGKVNSDDEWVEPEMHSLWEYPAYPRSEVVALMNFDLTTPVPITPMRGGGVIEVTHQLGSNGGGRGGGGGGGGGRCNGVVLWMDYQLTDKIITTTGLIKPPGGHNERLCWDSTSKQAVHFLSPHCALGTSHLHTLNYTLEFNTSSGELRFNFTGSL